MKRSFAIVAVSLVALGLSGCVAPVGPVEVTRYSAPEIAQLQRGSIVVEPAPGGDAQGLEFDTYAAAVSRELARVGFAQQPAGASDLVASVKVTRDVFRGDAARSPVSVGVGGSTGSYGSGVGVGVGINLNSLIGNTQKVETTLSVMIRQRSTGKSVWEGKAVHVVAASSPLATTALAAPKLAEALFRDFPGRSGETITVK